MSGALPEIHGFPSQEVEFTKRGDVSDPSQVRSLLAGLEAAGPAGLLVLAHGWNNNTKEALGLYDRFLAQLRGALDRRPPGAPGGRPVVMEVLWPSKKFTDRELIASGAASGGSPVTNRFLVEKLEDLKGVFDDPSGDDRLERAKELIPLLEDDPRAQVEFVDLMRGLMPTPTAGEEDAGDVLPKVPGDELFRRLEIPVLPAPGAPPAGPADEGSAASVGGWFSGKKEAARKMLNYATYYQMKERAGVVGAGGVHDVLTKVLVRRPGIRIHLVGHSFGGRLVTAAALGPDGAPALPVASVTLLQAAFSHYGFAERWDGSKDGFFRRVVTDGRVAGPILVTHSSHDEAVGVAYPIASQIVGQVASWTGGPENKYGGIGRNGALKTPEAVVGRLLPIDEAYDPFEAGHIYNLDADAVIADHSDICHPEVAHALVSAWGGVKTS